MSVRLDHGPTDRAFLAMAILAIALITDVKRVTTSAATHVLPGLIVLTGTRVRCARLAPLHQEAHQAAPPVIVERTLQLVSQSA